MVALVVVVGPAVNDLHDIALARCNDRVTDRQMEVVCELFLMASATTVRLQHGIDGTYRIRQDIRRVFWGAKVGAILALRQADVRIGRPITAATRAMRVASNPLRSRGMSRSSKS